MATSTKLFESRDKIMTPWLLFQNTFILRRPRVASFADIIRIAACLLKQPLKTQRKLEELLIMY